MNALLSIVLILEGNTISIKLEFPAKALTPILVMVFAISTLAMFSHPAKALFPISFTPSEKVTFLILSNPRN